MRLSIVLCSLLYCCNTMAITLEKRDDPEVAAALAARQPELSLPPTRTYQPRAAALEKEQLAEREASVEMRNAKPSHSHLPAPTCGARRSDGYHGTCNKYGSISHPHNPMVLPKYSFQKCKLACVCGSASDDCEAFSWDPYHVEKHGGNGNCTLFDKTVEEMGFEKERKVKAQIKSRIYNKDCYHHHTKTHTGHPWPTHTMGPYVLKKRADLDNYIMEALYRGKN